MKTLRLGLVLGVLSVSAFVGCGGGDDYADLSDPGIPQDAAPDTSSDSSTGGSSSGGTGGSGHDASTDAPSNGGAAGDAGSAGTAGDAGSAGTAGDAGNAGAAGDAGSAGTAGDAGSAGTGGTAGAAGTGGTAGAAGTGGTAGTGGAPGSCQTCENVATKSKSGKCTAQQFACDQSMIDPACPDLIACFWSCMTLGVVKAADTCFAECLVSTPVGTQDQEEARAVLECVYCTACTSECNKPPTWTCGPTPVAETVCWNGADDDGDKIPDCKDQDCNGKQCSYANPHMYCVSGGGCSPGMPPFPAGEGQCANASDDDNDGAIDCLDPDCNAKVCDNQNNVCVKGICGGAAPTETLCWDKADDDADTAVDCADDDCNARQCAYDNPMMMCVGGVCAKAGGVTLPESNCSDGLDNDSDEMVDCEDPDCNGQGCNMIMNVCKLGKCVAP